MDPQEVNLTLSIIIPTYNRSASLARLLARLNQQSYPVDYWEVVVVDDGSNDPGYPEVLNNVFKYPLIHFIQDHQGAVAARNLGALHSQADILVFLDDDVIVEPGYLEGLVQAHTLHSKVIVMGVFRPYLTPQAGPFLNAVFRSGVTQIEYLSEQNVDFYQCVSHNLSIKRDHFFEIGMFQDPTERRGWPNWDDIDLAYRAYKEGFLFLQVLDAEGSHIDHVLNDFQLHCKRIYEAGRSAYWLFKKYPELRYQLPMFRDKNPINLSNDSPMLVLRKITRAFLAWTPVLNAMEIFRKWLEQNTPNSLFLLHVYRLINSSYIFRGYRVGLSENREIL